MSALSTAPTATLNAASTVITSIVTVTVQPAPGLFLNNFWGCLTSVDLLLFLAGVWTALIVGFNVLSFLAFIIPGAAALGNGLLGWQIISGFPWRPAVYAFMQITWTTEHVGASLYSYFILKRLLSSKKRWRVFSVGFWLFTLGFVAITITNAYSGAMDLKSGGHPSPRILKIENDGRAPGFILLAVLELWSSAFLVVTLYQGRRNAKRASTGQPKRVNLLRQLAQSSEIRLATLASVGIIRTGAGWTGLGMSSTTPLSKRTLVQQLDNFAVILENMYPVLLIIDLLAARMAGTYPLRGSGTVVAHAAAHDSPASPVRGRNHSGGSGEKADLRGLRKRGVGAMSTMDSLRRDFGEYMGRSRIGKDGHGAHQGTVATVALDGADFETSSSNGSRSGSSSAPAVSRQISNVVSEKDSIMNDEKV